MEILGYILFVVVGVFFGLFGSGGSVIMLPILTYLFSFSIHEATTYNLVLVFLISLFGTVGNLLSKSNKNIRNNFLFKDLILFILTSLIFTSLSRVFLFVQIPDVIFFFSKENFLKILFAIVIFASAISVFNPVVYTKKHISQFSLIAMGALVGILTGLLGFGGGFIIVPVLIIFAGLEMKQAAPNALFIIMLNTLIAIFWEVTILSFSFDVRFILIVLVLALIGVFIGTMLLQIINVNTIKKLFSITLMLLSLVIFFIELLIIF